MVLLDLNAVTFLNKILCHLIVVFQNKKSPVVVVDHVLVIRIGENHHIWAANFTSAMCFILKPKITQ